MILASKYKVTNGFLFEALMICLGISDFDQSFTWNVFSIREMVQVRDGTLLLCYAALQYFVIPKTCFGCSEGIDSQSVGTAINALWGPTNRFFAVLRINSLQLFYSCTL